MRGSDKDDRNTFSGQEGIVQSERANGESNVGKEQSEKMKDIR